ncbi:Carboxylesterase NlhH [Variovorax sp. SRS16]|uniref:alpha/beta hydrolase n=1 Tax=Variovorax sp. SRS16 TaxID=282217 RepID=UPI001315CDCE|nr:alpha/beta hydrolase [Variovorax sp. SRS16]VTU13209.1 Carboxylesterase NlhH [Variovorax sp. SRS16]
MTNESVQAIRREIAKFGARFDESLNKATRSLYEPHLDRANARTETLDLAYGPHERNRLDLFSDGGVDLPIVLFVHGGGFIAGDKRSTDHFYANVGRYLAAKGFLCATMNYRLASTDGWPAGSEDVAAAVKWLSGNAGSHGGDSSRIGLLGQSAGCCHVAGYLFDPQSSSIASTHVSASALLSGYYVVKPPLSPGQQAYFGTDASRFVERSPATHVASNAVPVLLSLAEFDPPQIAQQTLEFAAALTASRGACPAMHWLAGHNHVSSALSLGTVDREVGNLLTGFFSEHLSKVAATRL